MDIRLSDHFTYSRLLRFTAPPIIMMICISIYGTIDSLFISNFIGSRAFAAIGVVFPVLMILGAFGFMVGSGGNALVAKTLGEQHPKKANEIFSLIVYSTLILGIFLSLVGLLLLNPFLDFLGVDGALRQDCLTYAHILIPGTPIIMLQFLFHSFFIAAERPKLGLFVAVLSGAMNILLDAVFVLGFHWGIAGAAWATIVSQVVGGCGPLLYFTLPNKSPLRLGKAKVRFEYLLKTYTNGLSEFLSHISASFINALYNYQLLRMMGESGVVAYGIIAHVYFLFVAIFLGYSSGSAPIVSYHYGARNHPELQNLFKKSLRLIAGAGVCLSSLAIILARPLADIFVGYDPNLANIAIYAFRVYALSFLVVGFNIYASAFFTALNNGVISAAISVSRIFVFKSLSILILPIFFGINGIWSASVVSESCALIVSIYFLRTRRKKYHYV